MQVKPLEEAFKFSSFFSACLHESDFEAKPSVLLMGQYSTGKTTFIKVGSVCFGGRIAPRQRKNAGNLPQGPLPFSARCSRASPDRAGRLAATTLFPFGSPCWAATTRAPTLAPSRPPTGEGARRGPAAHRSLRPARRANHPRQLRTAPLLSHSDPHPHAPPPRPRPPKASSSSTTALRSAARRATRWRCNRTSPTRGWPALAQARGRAGGGLPQGAEMDLAHHTCGGAAQQPTTRPETPCLPPALFEPGQPTCRRPPSARLPRPCLQASCRASRARSAPPSCWRRSPSSTRRACCRARSSASVRAAGEGG
jgi:hypothetical protein